MTSSQRPPPVLGICGRSTFIWRVRMLTPIRARRGLVFVGPLVHHGLQVGPTEETSLVKPITVCFTS